VRPRITLGGNLSDPAPFNCSAQRNRTVEAAQVENVAVVLAPNMRLAPNMPLSPMRKTDFGGWEQVLWQRRQETFAHHGERRSYAAARAATSQLDVPTTVNT